MIAAMLSTAAEEIDMIRRLNPQDLAEKAQIVQMVATDSRMTPREVEAILTDHDTWVYELDQDIVGLVCSKAYSRDYGLRVFVVPGYRLRGIGRLLYDHVRPSFDGPGPDKLTVTYRVDTSNAQPFFGRRGFEPWFQMTYLNYMGPKQAVRDADIRQYTDESFEVASSILGIAFYEMRRGHGFEPYDVRELHQAPETRANFAAAAADTFLAYDPAGRAVGYASVGGGFIDTVGVLPARRGEGFGRALTRHCINVLLDRGHAPVRTSVLADNLVAKELYLSLGFEHIATFEHATLQLR